MALVLHDWFAASNEKVNQAQLMIDQSNLFRSGWQQLVPGRCSKTLHMGDDWLDADQNRRNSPNENYAREVMELFTLGADAARTARPTSASSPGR